MKHLRQKPGEQKCLLYCAAMLLDISIETVESYLGTDGQDVWWPNLNPPKCYRGVHIQEIQDLFLAYRKCLYPIDHFPALTPNDDCRLARPVFEGIASSRFWNRIIGNAGILIYGSHAKVFDTDGEIYDPSSLLIRQILVSDTDGAREAWLVAEIKSK